MKQTIPIRRRTAIGGGLLLLTCLALTACRTTTAPEKPTASITAAVTKADPNTLAFVAAGDMRNFTEGAPAGKRYFDGACAAMESVGAGDFMITPGDFDPPAEVRGVIDRYLGSNYVWYPVVGNHEVETPEDMAWVQQWAAHIPGLVRRGPPGAELTTYSFDVGNSHFVAINNYFDDRVTARSKGSVGKGTLSWLEQDLAATKQPLIWVIGHQPLESLPDMDSGRVRHGGESVSTDAAAKARFIEILKAHQVRAYICGHTHNASVAKVEGIWQTDSGHARGAGDKGSPSTFLKFRVDSTRAWVDVYRSDDTGVNYTLRQTVELD